MSPKLALLLCTVFVLFLLRIDRKQTPNVSHALWIPTVWMLLIASKPLGVWFGIIGEDTESGSPLDRIFLIVLLCLGLLILAIRQFNWSSAVKEYAWPMLLIGYMLASILWSDIPFISFKRWSRELVAVVMAFLVLTDRDPRQAMQSLLRRSVYILIPFSVLLIKYFGDQYGVMYDRWDGTQMWVGVTTHKNSLGRLCLISAFFLIWTLFRRWQGRDIFVGNYQTYVDVFVLFMALWLLKGPPGAYSATSITALAVGLVAFIGLLYFKKCRINLGANTLAVMMVIVIGIGIITPMVGGTTVGGFTSTLGREQTLTGRTEIWAGLLSIAEQQPILGRGFGSFWTTSTIEAFDVSEAHNGYLEVQLELGFIGILLVSMFILSSCRKAQRVLAHDFDWAILWICYLLMTVIHNFTESSIQSFSNHLMAVLLFLEVSSKATSLSLAVSRE